MKKIAALLLALVMGVSLCACKGPAEQTGSVDDIPLKEIFFLFDDMEDLNLGQYCVYEEVTADNVNFHLGSQTFTERFDSALSLSPLMNITPMELILFRLSPGSDTRSFAAELKAQADPAKWVCVGAETVETQASGRTVLFYMGDSQTWDTLSQCFDRICQKGFRPEDHLKDPLADLTMEDLYDQLAALYGTEDSEFLSGGDLSEVTEENPLHLTAEDLKKVRNSLIEQGYTPADEFNMEGSYLFSLIRLSDETDTEELAERIAAEADLLDETEELGRIMVAYGHDLIVFFAGTGQYSFTATGMEQVLQGQYRMNTIGRYNLLMQ